MNKFTIAYDGFIQTHRLYDTVAEATVAWKKDIRNTLLYQYDCSVYEVNEKQEYVRRVSFEELTTKV